MEIVIHSMGMPFNGETISKQSLGGSESAAYYMARELARRGHRVSLFTSEKQEGVWDGVSYVWHGDTTPADPLGDRFAFYAANTPHDVLIIQRYPNAFHKDYAAKLTIWQLHDLAVLRNAQEVSGGLQRINLVTTVSKWQAEQIKGIYAVSDQALRVVPNGVDPALYAAPLDTRYTDGLGALGVGTDSGTIHMLYQSRPERGLEHLVRPGGIMSRLKHLPVKLRVCGYDFTHPNMAPYYQQLEAWAKDLPNVEYLGALTKKQLADLQRQSSLLIYPTEFEEVSCITAMEAMHAGLPMVTSEHAALPETCAFSGTELIPLKDGHADEDAFVQFVEQVVADPSSLDRMREAQLAAAGSRTWARAVDELERHIAAEMQSARTPAAVLRHCLDHGDIAFMDWYTQRTPPVGAIAEACARERAEMFKWLGDPEATRAHYERCEEVNFAALQRNGTDIEAELQNLMHSARFKGIAGYLARKQAVGGRVLDYGCAHGHMTLLMAKLFPDMTFVGMDWMRKSIGVAIGNAQKLDVPNALFTAGTAEDLASFEPFDVIVAADMIEHVSDYGALLERLRWALKPGGALIITTPYGRWEWVQPKEFAIGRQHLHHFEKRDWQDILRGHEHEIVCAPAGNDGTGSPLGCWVITVTPTDGVPFGEVDYQRKLSELVPRQTLSACLIVKDAEQTIGKALASVMTHVDEVVIAVDPSSSDGTREAIARAAAKFPWKPVRVLDGVVALQEGFDTARNITLDAADGDWIMWMDADEEVLQSGNLYRLLRRSSLNAFACPQIHYSAQPAQVLTTDYPCRLFRNRRGVRFYGLVHEHPEDVPGKSVANAMMAPDIQFLHNGYVDEGTRRRRFTRNLPLLLRDIEKHPTRILNKFLLLRDIAQGLMFEIQAGQPMTQERAERASQGLQLFKELLGSPPIVLRMVLDSLQYYTVCNELLNVGFVARVTWRTAKPPFDTLNAEGVMEARFSDRATYLQLLNLIAEETTRNYESKYI